MFQIKGGMKVMAGAELIGKEEIKEVMDVLKTGVFARYAFDNERQGIWKVRDFEKAFAKYRARRPSRSRSRRSTWDPGMR